MSNLDLFVDLVGSDRYACPYCSGMVSETDRNTANSTICCMVVPECHSTEREPLNPPESGLPFAGLFRCGRRLISTSDPCWVAKFLLTPEME